ncbi:unnamed protein product [Brassica oleracea]
MVLKDSIEEMFPKWSGEPDDPQLVSLITDIHAGRFVKDFWEVYGNTQGNAQGKRNEKKKKMKGGVSSEAEPPTKKQKKVKTQNESEATAAGKGSSEKEGSKDLELENKVTLTTITIDDRVKALLEEHLKVLGVGKIPENNDNPSPPSADKALSFASPRVTTQQNSVNSPALAATPGKVFGPKKNLAKELDKESGVKWTLAEEFGSVAKATDLDSQHIDFVLVSPSKATKDDKDAKVPDYGRGCRGKRTVKGEEADEKKKAAQADAAFKRKEKAEAKKKAAEVKKKDAEAKKKEAEAKKKEAEVMPIVPGYSTMLENSVNAILSSANRENLPLLYPDPGELLDTTSTIWFKFLSDLSLVIPSILAEGWVHDWPTYRPIPDHFKERWFLQLARHLFKWADECLVEEVEDIKSLISGMNKDISEFRLNVDRLEKEIEVMKTASEGKGEECMSQGRCLRNVVVCGVGMSLLFYYYFFV